MTRVKNKQRCPPAVMTIFRNYPKPLCDRLLLLRKLILETAASTPGVGAIEEALKWGQPSYLTSETKTGSTIRIDQLKSSPDHYALYFNCQTDLVSTFRELYPDALAFQGNRAIVLNIKDDLPKNALSHCITLALTYHSRRKRAARALSINSQPF